ncbi:MAG: hypothetical protein Q9227_003270 [Pyrenula ochraceoflavens]
MSEEIFQKQHHRLRPDGKVQGRFDKKALERTILKCISDAGLSTDTLLYDPDDASCRVFVCAMSKETSEITQFTSYISRDGMSDLLKTAKIWEAARATSAATSFFDPIEIGPNNETFIDGAWGANNPVRFMWYEAQQIWPSARLEDQIEVLVSIGTGEPGVSDVGDKFWEIFEKLKKIAAEAQKTADHFKRDHRDLVREKKYYRLNVDQGLQDVKLEEYKKRNTIVAATRHYLRSKAEEDLYAFADRIGSVGNPSPAQPNSPPNTQSTAVPSQQILSPPTSSTDQVPPSTVSREVYTFHTLTDDPKYINRDEHVPWRKLTEPAMTVYERIYDAAKSPDGHVELSSLAPLLPPALRPTILPLFWSLLALPEKPLSKGLTLSLIFMLHLRSTINSWSPENVSERRRRILRRAGEWVECSCGCARRWNFVNDLGMYRPRGETTRCKGIELREAGKLRKKFFSKEGRKVDEKNREAWKRRVVE